MVTVQKLFYDGENILRCNPNITFLHNNLYFLIINNNSSFKNNHKKNARQHCLTF
ncbi:hypothetical protein SDC9_87448 [bioreactor metagenome]|uniref:Uncharacterized protein n=1 Tax=bioreactor metagenome TaxID=1076179 RepID=A0A644ZIU7_9ZZZZ